MCTFSSYFTVVRWIKYLHALQARVSLFPGLHIPTKPDQYRSGIWILISLLVINSLTSHPQTSLLAYSHNSCTRNFSPQAPAFGSCEGSGRICLKSSSHKIVAWFSCEWSYSAVSLKIFHFSIHLLTWNCIINIQPCHFFNFAYCMNFLFVVHYFKLALSSKRAGIAYKLPYILIASFAGF